MTQPSPTEQPYLARRQNWTNQLARHALMQPDKPALRHLGRTITWAELDARVNGLADALSRRGVRFGDRVLILMLNRTEFIESFLAINKLGAIAVPVNFRMTAPEIAFLVTDCQAQVVITESVLAGVAAAVRELDPTFATVIIEKGSQEITQFTLFPGGTKKSPNLYVPVIFTKKQAVGSLTARFEVISLPATTTKTLHFTLSK